MGNIPGLVFRPLYRFAEFCEMVVGGWYAFIILFLGVIGGLNEFK